MKRMHLHVGVQNLSEAVKFYSALFGAGPVKVKADYAKWLLDDPRINFAISTRAGKPGLDHLGFQAEDEAELGDIRARIKNARLPHEDEGETTCCYATSDKTWLRDPAGIAWEAYRTMTDAEIYSSKSAGTENGSSCCAPKDKAASTGCCGSSPSGEDGCCA